jgi:nucleotide sugar dehydrogenase
MLIGIIGHGYVGSAISESHTDDDLLIKDIKLKKSPPIEEFYGCHAIYLCLPSPQKSDGSCDSSILENVLASLKEMRYEKTIISKTTLPPSVYHKLGQENVNLVHCPEFLTAANHLRDYKNTKYFILGGDKRYCERAREIIKRGVKLKSDDFYYTDIKTAALFKYLMNSYLATKVSFMNEFYELARSHHIEWSNIKKFINLDDRIGDTHIDVPGTDGKYGWGGACFPKDLSAIINEAENQGLDFNLLKSVDKINRVHRLK